MKESNITNIRIGITGKCKCCRKIMPGIMWMRKDSGTQMAVCVECGANVYMDVLFKGVFETKTPRWNSLTEEEQEMIAYIESSALDGRYDDYAE